MGGRDEDELCAADAPAAPGPASRLPVEESDGEAPAQPGEPWRIPGVGALPEGESKKLLLYPRDGPVLEVLLCRVDGVLHALDTECPHAGGRLAEGPLIHGRIARCPLHWFDFDPKSGRCLTDSCDPATVYRVDEVDGVALLYLRE